MAKEVDTTNETVTTAEAPKAQLRIDDAGVTTYYSSTCRIWGSAEEVIIDFSQGIRPSGQPNTALLKIDSRVILSPWAAKRLAIALGQTISRYEQTYGVLEIDARKRSSTPARGATTEAR
jgi:hypothetical protein